MNENKIIKLDKSISNKIAAGEVVERPSAVIKELVENAIDAGATKVTVEIKKGGKDYIRITDNGFGIAEEDVEIAFERHATSKIRSINDIYNISSLGFRGEALASIAAVSRTEMTTKRKDDDIGTKLEIAGGKVVYKDGVGCPDGTTLVITDLFYNTPARKKFMKSDQAEFNAISDIMNKLALSHPEVSFRYLSNDKNIFITPGTSDVFKSILSIYERSLSKNLVRIESEADGMKIHGYVSNLEYTRGNRQYQVAFVNGRYVKSKLIFEAINMAYKTRIPINRFAIAFLNIEIDPSLVDINIHPAKTEIRFHQEGVVKELIYKVIREELNRYNLIPKQSLENSFMKTYSTGITDHFETKSNISEIEKPQANKSFSEKRTVNPTIDITASSGINNNQSQKNKGIEASNPVNTSHIDEASANSGTPSIGIDHVKTNDSQIKPLLKDKNLEDMSRENKNSGFSQVHHSNSLSVEDKKIVSKYIDTVKESMGIAEDSIVKAQPTTGEQVDLFESIGSMNLTRSDVKYDDRHESFEAISQVAKLDETKTIYDDLIYVGQIFRTYLLFEKGKEMFMIDQHAAHEKIIYEEFMAAYLNSKIISQILLEPIMLELNYMEQGKVFEHIDVFNKLGFQIEEFGETTIIIREVPMMFSLPVSKMFVEEMINEMSGNMSSNYELSAERIITMSCKKAIKGNQRIDEMEVNSLVTSLKGLNDPYTCPHGRPIIISIRQYELEKKFKRV